MLGLHVMRISWSIRCSRMGKRHHQSLESFYGKHNNERTNGRIFAQHYEYASMGELVPLPLAHRLIHFLHQFAPHLQMFRLAFRRLFQIITEPLPLLHYQLTTYKRLPILHEFHVDVHPNVPTQHELPY